MVKRILKKILLIILIVLMLNNFFMTQVMAAEPLDTVVGVIEGILGGIVGILSFPFRLVAITIGDAVNGLTAIIAYTEKPTDTSIDTGTLTPFDILFNKVPILDINFFEIGDEENIVNQVRTGVATWYYVLRILASAILLVILVYVGIRMAVSTVASDRAMYKKMLVDWVCSLALIFVIQYIIVFAIYINNALVNAMSVTSDSEEISEAFNVIKDEAMKVFSLDAVGATVIYCMLVWQTIGLLISYFNRMLKIAFLIIISPLITLTYSIDKMGDGKAQALGKWLKEFVFTILMQPFHCIIYMCLINIAIDMLVDNIAFGGAGTIRDSLATALVAILCIRFVKEAEKIVRKIFAFQDDNSGTSLVAGMAASAVLLSNSKKFGKGARSTVNKAKNLGKNTLDFAKNAIVEAKAVGILMSSAESKSFTKAKEEARTQINNNKATKINNKINKNMKEYAEATENEVKKRTDEIISRTGGKIDPDEAKAQARLELAKERRTKRGAIRSRISKAKGAYTKGKNYINSFETVKQLNKDLKRYIAGGSALMMGSGVYGLGEKISTAITAGVVTNSSVSEFMKNSTNTIVGSLMENMKNLGANSPEVVAKEWDDTMENRDKYGDLNSSKADEELDKILNELFKVAGGTDEDKRNFKVKAKNIMQTKPDAAPMELARELSNLGEKGNVSETEAGQNLLKFANRHAMVTSVTNSKDIIPESQLRTNLLEKYTSNRAYYQEVDKVNTEANEFINKVKAKNGSDDGIEISDEAIKNIENTYNDKILELKVKMSDYKDNSMRDKLEKSVADLETEMSTIISKAIINKSEELKGKSLKMAEKYNKKLEDIIKNKKSIASNNLKINFKNEDELKAFQKEIADLEVTRKEIQGKINNANNSK